MSKPIKAKSKELAALERIIELLLSVDVQDRRRIMEAVAVFYGIEVGKR